MLERLWRPLVWHALAAFDRRYRYDSAYLRELFDANPRAFFQFSKVITASRFHEGVPAACGFAARFVATRHEGCGACAQLMLAMAAEAGVERAVLQALIDDDPAAMGDEAALGWHYAHAVLGRSADASEWADRVAARHGRPALASLALGVVLARCYPTMKTALGHAPVCEALQLPTPQPCRP